MSEVSDYLVAHASSVHPRDDVRIRHRYVEALRARGWRVTLIAPRPGTTLAEDPMQAIEHPIERSGLVGRLLRNFATVRSALRLRPDVVHIHDPELLLACPIFRLARIPVVYDVHEDVLKQIELKSWLPGFVRAASRWSVALLYRNIRHLVAGVVVVDPKFADFFAGVPVVTQRNYPLASEMQATTTRESARDSLGLAHDAIVAVSVGSLSPARDPESLVEAIRKVLETRDAVLVFAGAEQPTPFLTEHVERTGAGDFVRLLGHVGREDVNSVLAAADVALCVLPDTPTYRTALPTKLVEYVAAGKPVVVSDFPVCREFLHAHGSGVLVSPEDTDAIAEGIIDLATRDSATTSRGVPRWESDFTSVESLYRSVLA